MAWQVVICLAGIGMACLGGYCIATAGKPSTPPFFSGDYMIDLGDGYEVGYGPSSTGGNAVILEWHGETVLEGVEEYGKASGAVVGRLRRGWFICHEREVELYGQKGAMGVCGEAQPWADPPT